MTVSEKAGLTEHIKSLNNLKKNVMRYTYIKSNKDEQSDSAGKKIGRNDPCPCGSGKKYKNCCKA